MTSDQLRWLWTVVGLVGTLAGFAGIGVMWWLLRDATRYAYVLHHLVQQPGASLLHLQVDGEVEDLRLLVAIVALKIGVTGAAFLAGLSAFLGQTVAALWLLIATEILVVLVVIFLVILGLIKYRRVNRIKRTVRLNRQAR